MSATENTIYQEALAHFQKGNILASEQLLQKLLSSEPQNTDALYTLAKINCQQGRITQGIGIIKRLLLIDARQGRAHILLGMALSAAASYDDALASLEHALLYLPRSAVAHATKADILAELGRHQEAIEAYDRSLAITPDSPETLCNKGASLQRLKRYDEAEEMYERAASLNPGSLGIILNIATVSAQQGKTRKAIASYSRVISLKPNYIEALVGRALAFNKESDRLRALSDIDVALAIAPQDYAANMLRARILLKLRRPSEAILNLDKSLAAKPGDIHVLTERGFALQSAGQLSEAISTFDLVLSKDPHNQLALIGRISAFREMGNLSEVTKDIDTLIELNPSDPMILNRIGNIFYEWGRYDDAVTWYDSTLAVTPNYIEALINKGAALSKLHRHREAHSIYHAVLAMEPGNIDCLHNIGILYADGKKFTESFSYFEKVLSKEPSHAATLSNYAIVLSKMGRVDQALSFARKALNANPRDGSAFSILLYGHLANCEWVELDNLRPIFNELCESETSFVEPFAALEYQPESAIPFKFATRYARTRVGSVTPLARLSEKTHVRLRIAYVSADFRQHPVGQVIARLIELHDRSRFEVIGISLGVDDGSEARQRLVNAFDQFHDVARNSDREIAELIQSLEVDIAVDLMGYTDGCRPDVFSYRPAPVQVNYLGFPSTIGSASIDFIIADRAAIPETETKYFTEKVVYLQDSFMAQDDSRPFPLPKPSRSQCSLPEAGFVFCCFNNTWKIRREMFDVWMRILQRVDGSVLWLSQGSNRSSDNLRREAEQRGIDPARIIFASKLKSYSDHLARHQAADLFLDTLPYNAHSTAGDALWAGLPILTCAGDSFAGRVCASMLSALDLKDLITASLIEYENQAVRLAQDPVLLASYREKVFHGRSAGRLFDAGRYRDNIERAYMTMWQSVRPNPFHDQERR